MNQLSTVSQVVQAAAAAVSVVLTIITIVVLVRAKHAADRQAEAAEGQASAARALTEVSEAQLKASQTATEMAERANRLSTTRLVADATPILVLKYDLARSSGALVNKAPYLIENQGPGAAQNVKWNYIEAVIAPQYNPISSTIIGSGFSAQISVDQGRLERGLEITGNSLDGRQFTTTVRMLDGTLMQEQAVVKTSD